ncbi:DUF3325 domain-containing protein [Janthinobacterium sp. PC23-8]|uniref:DUF3325 domain-containing protein n=1 Tax=Janthinobacterium sp. PC23-8 TaxID=2012679 RepID=UPI000B97622C|nr:DUF3325 domain-containing protein [Janthinobacterium sp. PC23-8]OYO30607.1 hypothetical protein CD932_05265 [Janthinobacterium sp. PC23-8]
MEILSDFLVFALSYAGLSCLCLAMDRHYADLHGRGMEPPPQLRRRLRWGGAVALAFSLAWAMHIAGAGQGAVFWIGSLTGCGLLLIWLLPYAPQQAMRLARVIGVIGVAALVAAVMLAVL